MLALLCLCGGVIPDWSAREAEPFLQVEWSAEVRDARYQRSIAFKRQFYGEEPWDSWDRLRLPAIGEHPKLKGGGLLQGLLPQRKKPDREPLRGTEGSLIYYHPDALVRSIAYLPGSFPLRHQTVRFAVDTQSDFKTFLKKELRSYRNAELSHEVGSSAAAIVVSNPRYDAARAAEGEGILQELLATTTENNISLLPAFFEVTHESFTIHYRDVEGVFFKSAFEDLHSYPLRKFAKRIRSYQKHDFALRVTPESLPTGLRDGFLGSMAKQAQPSLQPRDAEPDSRYQARLALAQLQLQLQLQTVSSLVRDVKDASVTLSGLRPGETIEVDLKLEPRPGTGLATLLNNSPRRTEISGEGPISRPAMSLQFNGLSAVREFLKTQLQWISPEVFGDGLPSAADAMLAEAESVKLRLLEIDERWVVSIVVDGKLAKAGENFLSFLNQADFLVPSKASAAASEFSFDAELREKHSLPDSLAVSIESERVHLVIGPSSTLSKALATDVIETGTMFDLSADIHALWGPEPGSVIDPRNVVHALEKAAHQMMLNEALPAKYAGDQDTEKSYSRQLFAARMRFDPNHHSLVHLLDEKNSRIHIRANTGRDGLRLRASIGQGIVEAIEARKILVSQFVLADSTRRFRKMTPQQLLDELEKTGMKIPESLRDRIRKAGDAK